MYTSGLYLAKFRDMLGEFQNWLTYMLQHWNSCRPESAMTRAIYHVSASEPIPINFQVFAMSLELALNHVANGQRVLLILGQYDALRYAVLWSSTTAVLTEIGAYVSAQLQWGNIASVLSCGLIHVGKLSRNWKFAHSAIGRRALIILIQSVALKYMKFWWFTIAIWTDFASIFITWFSLQIYATCSVQPCLLLTHAYQLSVLAPTVSSLAWGNLAYNSNPGTTIRALQDASSELWDPGEVFNQKMYFDKILLTPHKLRPAAQGISTVYRCVKLSAIRRDRATAFWLTVAVLVGVLMKQFSVSLDQNCHYTLAAHALRCSMTRGV